MNGNPLQRTISQHLPRQLPGAATAAAASAMDTAKDDSKKAGIGRVPTPPPSLSIVPSVRAVKPGVVHRGSESWPPDLRAKLIELGWRPAGGSNANVGSAAAVPGSIGGEGKRDAKDNGGLDTGSKTGKNDTVSELRMTKSQLLRKRRYWGPLIDAGIMTNTEKNNPWHWHMITLALRGPMVPAGATRGWFVGTELDAGGEEHTNEFKWCMTNIDRVTDNVSSDVIDKRLGSIIWVRAVKMKVTVDRRQNVVFTQGAVTNTIMDTAYPTLIGGFIRQPIPAAAMKTDQSVFHMVGGANLFIGNNSAPSNSVAALLVHPGYGDTTANQITTFGESVVDQATHATYTNVDQARGGLDHLVENINTKGVIELIGFQRHYMGPAKHEGGAPGFGGATTVGPTTLFAGDATQAAPRRFEYEWYHHFEGRGMPVKYTESAMGTGSGLLQTINGLHFHLHMDVTGTVGNAATLAQPNLFYRGYNDLVSYSGETIFEDDARDG